MATKEKVNKEVKKVEFNGKQVSTHQLILLVNAKWSDRLKLSALEKFLKHEIGLKSSPAHKLAELTGVKAENINYNFIKAVFYGTRLIDSKGKAKKRFSPFSWLKDLETRNESGELAELLKADAKKVETIAKANESERIESLKLAS